MPFDSKGDVYVQYSGRDSIPQSDSFMALTEPEIYLMAIGPDGSEISRNVIRLDKYRAVGDGIGYNTSASEYYPLTAENLTGLRSKSLVAYNINNGTILWNYTFPVDNPTVVTVDDSNAGEISPYLTMNNTYTVNDYEYHEHEPGPCEHIDGGIVGSDGRERPGICAVLQRELRDTRRLRQVKSRLRIRRLCDRRERVAAVEQDDHTDRP